MKTTTMKTQSYILGLVLAASLPATAAFYDSGTITQVIPDNSTIGTGDALNTSFSGEPTSITDLTLTFALLGGYSGDLSGYLRLGNEVGSPAYSLTSFLGSQTLSPSVETLYTLSFGTATYGSAFQSVFAGQDPNNTWTLFIADTSAGAQTTLKGWSLDITAVPEPATWAGMIFGGGMAVFYGLRSQSARGRLRRWRMAVNEWLDAA